MGNINKTNLAYFGFTFTRNSVHTSRTMMLEELKILLSCADNPNLDKDGYLRLIDERNCLGKRSVKTRILTYRHLTELYSLDSSLLLYRALIYFWQREAAGQALIALLCACSRDSILRASAFFILKHQEGATITRDALEEFIDEIEPGRFSKATLKSTAQNINSTWTKSNHLTGRARKIRNHANPTAASVSYALLLGYISGFRGKSLFETEYTKLLDCSFEKAIELAEEASRKSWIVLKRVGSVVEVLFPNLISKQEQEWLNEQNQTSYSVL